MVLALLRRVLRLQFELHLVCVPLQTFRFHLPSGTPSTPVGRLLVGKRRRPGCRHCPPASFRRCATPATPSSSQNACSGRYAGLSCTNISIRPSLDASSGSLRRLDSRTYVQRSRCRPAPLPAAFHYQFGEEPDADLHDPGAAAKFSRQALDQVVEHDNLATSRSSSWSTKAAPRSVTPFIAAVTRELDPMRAPCVFERSRLRTRR
jgi:hypothetical protein